MYSFFPLVLIVSWNHLVKHIYVLSSIITFLFRDELKNPTMSQPTYEDFSSAGKIYKSFHTGL